MQAIPAIPATLFLTAIFAVMLTVLSLLVSLQRRSAKIGTGDGDNIVLRRRIRAHGNFIENAPLLVLVCAVLEISATASSATIWALAVAFMVARLLHALGVLKIPVVGSQAVGMVLQHVAILIGAALLLRGLI
ncbi:MAPEG family protein [Thalassospira mesophila]|uniref:MAPEG family protein n=1 Tax=Thalassospira mesophila TaxID=1293891 RepID=A0A1Y2L2S6_9PROT|nr:MAPEG family protein [Thalassospira mesophila]OSQ39781.1 hypothetical protein TMES_07505 [Thalassospira mesophila]